MTRTYILFALIMFSLSLAAQDSISVMTYNIRYDNPDDGKHAWSFRKEPVIRMLQLERPMIIGMQEVLLHQLNDVLEFLPTYSFTGCGRDDGKSAGEYCPIFYDSSLLKLMASGDFWLSANPEMVGVAGWDAACPRICTWAKFVHKNSLRQFFVFNTHFDHVGAMARVKSSELLLQVVDSLTISFPVVLCGDFNTNSSSAAISLICQSDFKRATETDDIIFSDTCTYTGFRIRREDCKCIDYIFFTGQFQQYKYQLLSNPDENYPLSDHRAVLVSLLLN